MTTPAPFTIPTDETQFTYSGVRYRPAAGTTILALVTETGREIGYLERGHIFVWKSVNGFVTAIPLVRPDDYNFDGTGTSIVLVEPTVAGEEYILLRDTPLDSYIVFADGATLTAEQLNRLARANLYRDQEQVDAFASGGGGGGGGGGGSGTVVRVTGGAGLNGDITVSGSLNVGAGPGISALTDTVAINRTAVDTWYAAFTHGHSSATSTIPGFMSAADKVALDALVAEPDPVPGPLDSLSDVTISGPVASEILSFDGTKWINSLTPAGPGQSAEERVDRRWDTATSGVPATGKVRLNAAAWKSATQVVMDFKDYTTDKSDESMLRKVVVGTPIRISHQSGTLQYTVRGSSFTTTTATFTVDTPTGNSSEPVNDKTVSITLNAATVPSGAVELNQLNDVTLTSPASNDVLKFVAGQWVNGPVPGGGGGATNLDGLTDVVITTPANTQILQFNGTNWVNAAAPAGGGGATNLDGLSDVTITTPATDQVLKFNGTAWVNAASPGGGGGTVTQVDGGAGLTGSVTTTGSLAVGAGTGITVAADSVSINRTQVDPWYATAAQGVLAGTALQSVNLGYTASSRTITNSGGTPAVLPLVDTSNAGLVAARPGNTTTFLRGDGTWAAPPAGGGGATNLDGLTDVSVGSPVARQFLVYAGPVWENLAADSVMVSTTEAGFMSASDKVRLNGLSDLSTLPALP